VAGLSFLDHVHHEDAPKAETRLQATKRHQSSKLEMLEKRKILAGAELAAAEITEAALKTEGAVAEDADAEVRGEDGLKARRLPAMLNMNDRDGLGDKNYAFALSFSFYFAYFGCSFAKAAVFFWGGGGLLIAPANSQQPAPLYQRLLGGFRYLPSQKGASHGHLE
jgi:hypothetical protein